MKIEPKTLVQIAAVVETGGFERAAALLGTSQPAISRDIAALEARLGAQLFDRSVRPVAPTELCLALAEDGATILFARRQAALKLDRARSGTSGVIRLVGPPLVTDHVVTPMFASFHSKHPGVEIQMQAGYVDQAWALLKARRVDFALVAVEKFSEIGLLFVRLMQSRNVVACRLDHPLTRNHEIQLSAMLDYGWVAPPEDSPLDQDLQKAMQRLGVSSAAIRFRSSTSAGIRTYLENTDCLAVLPVSVVAAMGRRYDVTSLPLDLTGPTRQVGLVSSTERNDTPLLQRFRSHLVAEFEKL